MIPVSLRLVGFLSYLDPVELDFTGFDLACISGSNGAGKSSLLDAITWALFGKARAKSDELVNSRSTAAEVTFVFDYENTRYRVQRTQPRDKTSLLELAAWDGERWGTLTERSLRGTEEKIRKILRLDFETFTNASFFLQGKADQFAQEDPTGRKTILASILGLEVWEEYKEEASRRRKALEGELQLAEELLKEAEDELRAEPERRAKLEQAILNQKRLEELRDVKKALLDQYHTLETRLVEQRRGLDRQAAELRAAQSRLDERLALLDQRRAEQAELAARLAAADEIEAAYAAWQADRAELARWDGLALQFSQYETERAAPRTEIEAERARLEAEQKALQQRQAQLEDLSRDRPRLLAEQESLNAQLADLAARLERRPELETWLRDWNDAKATLVGENASIYKTTTEMRARITQLSETSGAECPLCGQPLGPEERQKLIEQLEAEGLSLKSVFIANKAKIEEGDQRSQQITAELNNLSNLQKQHIELQRKLDQNSAALQRLDEAKAAWVSSGDAARLDEVNRLLAEDSFAPAARAKLAEVDARLMALGYDAAAHDAQRRRELAGRESEEALRRLEAARAALGPLERELATLQADTAAEQDRLLAAQAALQAAEQTYAKEAAGLPDLNAEDREYYALQEQVNQANRLVGTAQQEVAVLETRRKQVSRYSAEKLELQKQIARLKALEKAFSKAGIPALLIEQALPEIEAQANEILDRLSAGAMSVRFETQREYKDKKREDKKETLDIVISDASGVRPYELFSGGEAFRVNFAIRLALSRVLAQRAGARLQTLVIDEGFGSQDAEGRQRLIEAINMVQPDFAKILVITHLEELKDAFPARIEVYKTPRGSRLELTV